MLLYKMSETDPPHVIIFKSLNKIGQDDLQHKLSKHVNLGQHIVNIIQIINNKGEYKYGGYGNHNGYILKLHGDNLIREDTQENSSITCTIEDLNKTIQNHYVGVNRRIPHIRKKRQPMFNNFFFGRRKKNDDEKSKDNNPDGKSMPNSMWRLLNTKTGGKYKKRRLTKRRPTKRRPTKKRRHTKRRPTKRTQRIVTKRRS